MLNIREDLNFYFLPTFTDMRCKYDRVVGIVREQLEREPAAGDIYIVMSRDRMTVRLFAFEASSVSLYEKRFKRGHKFMRVVHNGAEATFRINWEDVRLLMSCPVINSLNIR